MTNHPMATKEPLCCVVSTDGGNHRIAEFKHRTIYRKADGSEWAAFLTGKRRIDRTRDGLAVLHIDWRSAKTFTL